ncbi:hypothetical protein [Nitratireductor sp. GCM10026969]|uniref:hypothetical protein n=1 Tax=Nitratireductor sp. GCM10026969 TaxID=3252645 RepID=UPI00361F4350
MPLIARAAARDWNRVDALLELTLRSVLAQSDGTFELLLAGHDVPPSWNVLTRGDPRFRFLRADWPVDAPTTANDDGGCKKWMIKEAVREGGGGLMMYLDADDLVASYLVETARRLITPQRVGAVLDRGYVVDFGTLHAVELPDGRVFDGGFHRLCGSSTIARVEPASSDPMRFDPHETLGSHHLWPESAREAGVDLVRLPVPGAYFVNTDENHSELYGPFAEWRRTFNAAVRSMGVPLDGHVAARFGLTREILERHSGLAFTDGKSGRQGAAHRPVEPLPSA